MNSDLEIRDSLSRQMGFLFVGRLVAFILTFATPLVLVRVFSQEEFGLYKQLFLLHGTLLILLSWGLPSSLYYFLPRDENDRSVYVCQTIALLAACGVIGFAGLLGLKGSLAAWLNNTKLEPLIPYLGVVIFLALLSSILEIVMITARQAKLASLTTLVSEFTKAWLIIGAAVTIQSMVAILVAMMAFGAFRIGALALYLRREGLLACRALDREYLRAQVTYALPFGMATIADLLASTAPYYYVAAMYDPALFAVFAVGCFTPPLVLIAFNSVTDVTLVRITEHEKAGSLDRMVDVLSDSIRKLCLICFPLFLFLLIVAKDFVVVLFTRKFEASVPIFMIFVLSIPLAALSLDYVPRAFADMAFLLKVNMLRLVITLILLFVLTGPLGLSGAAVATVSALAITRYYVLTRVTRLTRTSLRKLVPWRILGKIAYCSIIPCGTVLLINHLIEVPAFPGLIVSSMVFSAMYLLLVWKSRLITEEEKVTLAHSLKRTRGMVAGERVPAGPNLS